MKEKQFVRLVKPYLVKKEEAVALLQNTGALLFLGANLIDLGVDVVQFGMVVFQV